MLLMHLCKHTSFKNNMKAVKDINTLKIGDTIVWYNGPITFKEKIIKLKDGRLGVSGVSGDIPLTTLKSYNQLFKESNTTMKNTDTLLEDARTLITTAKLDENVDNIKSIVSTVKVGDSTNFGKVLEIGANSITFKAKDLPKTTIPFNARKMGSKDYVLDKLIKLKENKLQEVLDPNDDAGVWIDDFVKSDNPKFAGKSKEERIKMALGAWYAAQKKESFGEETLEESDDYNSLKNVFNDALIMAKSDFVHALSNGIDDIISSRRQTNAGTKSELAELQKQANDVIQKIKKDIGKMDFGFSKYIKEDTETLEEATLQKQTLKQILRVMETQSFDSWYKKDFTDYIEGDADGKTEEEILDDLNGFFN